MLDITGVQVSAMSPELMVVFPEFLQEDCGIIPPLEYDPHHHHPIK
jgi:hypothetical protein